MKSLLETKAEVEEMRDGIGNPIDPKIKDLVIGLRAWGIKTEMSCEGHTDRGMSFPWVTVSHRQAKKVAKLIALQNRPVLMNGKDNDNFWVIKPGSSLKIMPEDKKRPLDDLQKAAVEFGEFIQRRLQ